MNDRLQYVKDMILEKAISQEQIDSIESLNWGTFNGADSARGVLENNANFYFYSVTDKMIPTFFGPMNVNQIIGYVGKKCSIDMQEYSLKLADMLAYNHSSITGYSEFQQRIK